MQKNDSFCCFYVFFASKLGCLVILNDQISLQSNLPKLLGNSKMTDSPDFFLYYLL